MQREQASTTKPTQERVIEILTTSLENRIAVYVIPGDPASTPAKQMAGMCEIVDPIAKEMLAQGACRLPQEMQGNAPKEIK